MLSTSAPVGWLEFAKPGPADPAWLEVKEGIQFLPPPSSCGSCKWLHQFKRSLGVQPQPAGGNKTLRTSSAGIQSSAKTVLSIYLIPLFHYATLLLRTPKHFLNFSFFEEKMRKSRIESEKSFTATDQRNHSASTWLERCNEGFVISKYFFANFKHVKLGSPQAVPLSIFYGKSVVLHLHKGAV